MEKDHLVALPLVDGSFGLAHVARAVDRHNTLYVLHSCRSVDPHELAVCVSSETALAVRVASDQPIIWGDWIIVCKKAVSYELEIPQYIGKWSGYTILQHQLSAYHGLVPWDGSVFHRQNLLPGVPNPPPTARFKKDFVEIAPGGFVLRGSVSAVSSIGATPSALGNDVAEDAPALLEINLLLEDGQQEDTVAMLEKALEARGVGEVETVETGKLDAYLFVLVPAAGPAKAAVERLLVDLGLTASVKATDDDEDEDEDEDDEDDEDS